MSKHPLRRWRESHDTKFGLTELASRLGLPGIDAPQLSRIELRKVEPSLRTACRIEEITGIPPREFLRTAKPTSSETIQEQHHG